VFRCLF